MGDLYSLDEFIERVKETYFIDYDGGGDILNKEGETIGRVRCNVSWLKRFKKQHPEAAMVRWYNR